MLYFAAVLALALFQAADHSAEGIKALEAQQYEAAVEHFTKAAEADPEDFTAHFHLALAYSFLEKDSEAIDAYRKTLELQPGLYQARLNLGIVLLRQKQPKDAIKHLEEAARQKPAEFRPQFYLAEALAEAGEHPKAEQQFKTALQLDPKSPAAELGLGRSIARQGRLSQAAAHFRKAAELDPEFRDSLLELAALYEDARQPGDAMEIYKQFPEHPAAQERLGQLLLESREFAEALPRLEAAARKDPTPANRLALATAYHLNQQSDRAVPLLDQLVAAEPRNYDLHMLYGRVLRDMKQFQSAARQFHRSVQLRPDAREAWNELAGMLFALESYEQTIAALDQSRKLGDTSAGNLYFRALSLDRLRQYKPALQAYLEFLASSQGKNPEEEFLARQRVRVIEKELSKR